MPFTDANYPLQITVKAMEHALSEYLVEALVKFVDHYREHQEPMAMGAMIRTLKFTPSQYSNFHLLRNWGLVKKLGDDADFRTDKKKHLTSNMYVPLQRGYEFRDGAISVPNYIASWSAKKMRMKEGAIAQDDPIWQKWEPGRGCEARMQKYIHEYITAVVPTEETKAEETRQALGFDSHIDWDPDGQSHLL